MQFKKIGFIGAGNMAMAIADGLARSSDILPSKQYFVYAPSNRSLPGFEIKFNCRTTVNLERMIEFEPDIVFLCVKPSVLLRPLVKLNHRSIIVSVAAGIPIDAITKSVYCPNATYVRIMTNTSCSMGKAVCAVHVDPAADQFCVEEDKKHLHQLLSTLGDVQFVEENHMNVITALAGSGPAFGYTFIQALADGAVKMGLPRNLATRFAAQTLLGSAHMVCHSREHPTVLRDNVCSPGGTTIYGIHALEKSNFSSAVIDAIEAATIRAAELSIAAVLPK